MSPTLAPKLRYYCLAMPTDAPSAGFDYLEAIHKAGMRVKACPIGPAFVAGKWPELMHLFTAPMPADRFVNIVCAPVDLSLGFALTKASVAPEPCVPGQVVVRPTGKDPAVVYQPKTALSGLFTVGVPNVAITSFPTKPPSEMDLQALQRYDLIIALKPSDTEAFAARGITVVVAAAEDFPALLVPMVTKL